MKGFLVSMVVGLPRVWASTTPSISPTQRPQIAPTEPTLTPTLVYSWTGTRSSCLHNVTSPSECSAAASYLDATYKGKVKKGNRPSGCFRNKWSGNKIYWNKKITDTNCSFSKPCVCKGPRTGAEAGYDDGYFDDDHWSTYWSTECPDYEQVHSKCVITNPALWLAGWLAG